MTAAFEQRDADRDQLSDWEKWRPREDERFSKEVREKTVERACVNRNQVEDDGKTAVETVGEAVGDMGRAVENASKGRNAAASRQSREACKGVFLSVDTVARKLVRTIEMVVYRYIVSRTNPYYFDSEPVSAELQRKRDLMRRSTEEQAYELAVTINDEDILEDVRESVMED